MFEKKRQEVAEDRIAKQMDGIRPDDDYYTMEVAAWSDVKLFCNAMSRQGWRLHTLRDGVRGNGVDMGYRLLFERRVS